MPKKRNYKKELNAIYNELADSVLSMSDSEIKEEVEFLGEEFNKSVKKTRALIEKIVKRHVEKYVSI